MLMKASSQSLTDQLSARFSQRIRDRLLAPGARLPSVRQCAQQHEVSPSTVVAAYDQLVQRHMRSAFSIAYRLLGQREDAEDLVQDAFMVALEKIDTFREGHRFAPWFFRILVNRGLNARKSRALRTTHDIPDAAAARGASPERPSGTVARCSRRERPPPGRKPHGR